MLTKKNFVAIAAILLLGGGSLLTYTLTQDDETMTASNEVSNKDSDDATASHTHADGTTHTHAEGCLTAVQNATIDCEGTEGFYVLESNGLPTHQMMVGILNGGWNGQWPDTQDYTGNNAFFIPTSVSLVDDPPRTIMNTAGVTANGIPFFFPHAPGQPGSSECVLTFSDTECLRDPVAAGEMDECGGHTGRGNDYHYHATPSCLIAELGEGEIIAYMLDGIPIYAQPIEGSTRYDDECAGYVSPDGLLHYAFIDDYPYVTDCMLGEFQEGPSTGGSNVFTGSIDTRSSGSITGFTTDENGCHVMTFSSGQSLTNCL